MLKNPDILSVLWVIPLCLHIIFSHHTSISFLMTSIAKILAQSSFSLPQLSVSVCQGIDWSVHWLLIDCIFQVRSPCELVAGCEPFTVCVRHTNTLVQEICQLSGLLSSLLEIKTKLGLHSKCVSIETTVCVREIFCTVKCVLLSALIYSDSCYTAVARKHCEPSRLLIRKKKCLPWTEKKNLSAQINHLFSFKHCLISS